MKTILKMFVAAIVAAGMAVVLVAHGASINVAVASYFGAAIAIAALLGVFDVPAKREKHDSIRNGRRNYSQAAVFIGTACLFTGSVQECRQLADDLWHYAQQAEVRTLTGDMEFETL